MGPVRLDPVGLDRHYNRYWLLPAAAVATDPATVHPAAPPLLVIERHAQDSLAPTGAAAAAAAVLGGPAPDVPVGGGAPGWQVGVYNSILQLQQLAQWLCPKGTRERPLADYVTRLLDQHQQFAMAHAQIARGPAPDWQPLEPAAARAAAVQRLQRAMLSFEEGNQVGGHGWAVEVMLVLNWRHPTCMQRGTIAAGLCITAWRHRCMVCVAW